jgi:hypothetical protein
MNAVLDHKVLVLNKAWQPINVLPSFKAICKLYTGKAEVIDPNYMNYDFYDWVENWSDLNDTHDWEDRMLETTQFKFPIPEIIRMNEFKGYVDCSVKFNRKNVYERDQYTCQYCGTRHSSAELNLDHVMPRSRGGKSNWKNIVVTCISCNSRKADRTPEEAGMPLIRQPFKPQMSQIHMKVGKSMPKSWEDFIGKLYWQTDLKD